MWMTSARQTTRSLSLPLTMARKPSLGLTVATRRLKARRAPALKVVFAYQQLSAGPVTSSPVLWRTVDFRFLMETHDGALVFVLRARTQRRGRLLRRRRELLQYVLRDRRRALRMAQSHSGYRQGAPA